MTDSEDSVKDEVKKEARRRKAARSRKMMVRTAVIISSVIVVALVAVILYVNLRPAATKTAASDTPLEQESVSDTTSTTDTLTTIPNLVSLFGKTTTDAVAVLGPQATLTSTTAASDAANPNVVTLATVTLAAEHPAKSEKDSTDAAEVYLSLDANGQVVGVLYSVPLDNIGYGYALFKNLLADSDFVVKTLTAAGCQVSSFTPQVPEEAAYQTMTTDASGNQVMGKESYTYNGQTGLASTPMLWSINYTYDYSSSTVSGKPSDALRTMRLTLS